MTNSLACRIANFGVLRSLLIALAILAIVLAPEPQIRTVIAWPLIVPTLFAPAIAPLVLMVILFDLVMAKVMLSGEKDVKKRRHARQVMLVDAIAIAAILYAYLPFFLALGR